jgi:superfamily I DNA/RNA helicase
MKLTDEQDRAIQAGMMCCIMACAGAGKSTVLVQRIRRFVQERLWDPKKIVAITYTRKAAHELQEKLKKVGVEIGYCGTVHSWCLSLINSQRKDKLKAAPDQLFRKMIADSAKTAGCDESVNAILASEKVLHRGIVQRTRAELETSGLIDFDGILTTARNLCHKKIPISDYCLFVDEYQDTGPVEQEIYTQAGALTIVGDWRQTLYEFRGADVESMEKTVDAMHMQVVPLTKNFRCAGHIQDGADEALNATIHAVNNPYQRGKLWKMIETVKEKNGTLTILCGYNATLEVLRRDLEGVGIKVSGQRPDREIQALEAYLRWRDDPSNDALCEHLFNVATPELLPQWKKAADEAYDYLATVLPEGGIAEWKPLEARMKALQEAFPGFNLSDLAEFIVTPTSDDQPIKLMTVHASKGLEWDNVLFVDDLSFSYHHRRMRYVAHTRARKWLGIMLFDTALAGR